MYSKKLTSALVLSGIVAVTAQEAPAKWDLEVHAKYGDVQNADLGKGWNAKSMIEDYDHSVGSILGQVVYRPQQFHGFALVAGYQYGSLGSDQSLGAKVWVDSTKPKVYADTLIQGALHQLHLGVDYQVKGSFWALGLQVLPGVVYSDLKVRTQTADCKYATDLGSAISNVLGNTISGDFKVQCELSNLQAKTTQVQAFVPNISAIPYVRMMASGPVSVDLQYQISRLDRSVGLGLRWNFLSRP